MIRSTSSARRWQVPEADLDSATHMLRLTYLIGNCTRYIIVFMEFLDSITASPGGNSGCGVNAQLLRYKRWQDRHRRPGRARHSIQISGLEMTRGNKLAAPTTPKLGVEALLEKIIDDVLTTATMSFDDWWALSKTPLVPLAIPVGPGTQYRVTQIGVDAAHTLAGMEWKARADLRQRFSRKDYDRLAFTAIGEAVSTCRSHLPPVDPTNATATPDDAFYKAVADDFAANLDRLAAAAGPEVDRHIPCQLFDADQGVPGFRMGPVEFLPRPDWIARYVVNPRQLALVMAVEAGVTTFADLRQKAFAAGPNHDECNAWTILSALKNNAWVGSIRLKDHALEQSHRKASTLVGLAIDAIGLRFDVQSARRFTKAGRQHLYSEERLASSPAGQFLSGSSVRMPGLGAAPGALAAKMAAEAPFLSAVGELLNAYVEGRQTGKAPHLVERWANALYWVGEARREQSDFMAVVNYGCAADGLSGAGGLAKEMVAFAEVALNPKKLPDPPGSLSVAQAVNRVYREGRNKLAHGEAPGLFEDLADLRSIGDNLLAQLFDIVTIELAAALKVRKNWFEVDEKSAYKAFRIRLEQRP